MSIKTTKTVNRNFAIERIVKIYNIILIKHYKNLEKETNEDYDVFFNSYTIDFIEELEIDISNILNWTNKMLENILDKPFYRESMFNNYFVED